MSNSIIFIIFVFMSAHVGATVNELPAFDCEKASISKAYDMGLSINCTDAYMADIIGTPVNGSLVQMPAVVPTVGLYCTITRLTTRVYCSYEREGVPTLGSEAMRTTVTIPVPGPDCALWAATNIATGPFGQVTVVTGHPLTLVDSTEVDDQGFCVSYSEWISVDYYTVLLEQQPLYVNYAGSGDITHLSGPNGQMIIESTKNSGITLQGVGVAWSPTDAMSCPWRLVFSGAIVNIYHDLDFVGVTAPELKAGYRIKDNVVRCGLHGYSTTDPYVFYVPEVLVKYAAPSPKETSMLYGMIRGGIDFLSLHHGMDTARLASVGLTNICRLEQSVRAEAMYSSKESPEELGFRIMNRQGFGAVVAGETLRISGCAVRRVVLTVKDTCYTKIPVKEIGSEWEGFMDPITRTLTRAASKLECTDDSLPIFKIGDAWFHLTPELNEIHVESSLRMDSVYDFLSSLPGPGLVYSEDVLDEVERQPSYAESIRITEAQSQEFINDQLGNGLQNPSLSTLANTAAQAMLYHYIGGPSMLIMLLVLTMWMVYMQTQIWKANRLTAVPQSITMNNVMGSPARDRTHESAEMKRLLRTE